MSELTKNIWIVLKSIILSIIIIIGIICIVAAFEVTMTPNGTNVSNFEHQDEEYHVYITDVHFWDDFGEYFEITGNIPRRQLDSIEIIRYKIYKKNGFRFILEEDIVIRPWKNDVSNHPTKFVINKFKNDVSEKINQDETTKRFINQLKINQDETTD